MLTFEEFKQQYSAPGTPQTAEAPRTTSADGGILSFEEFKQRYSAPGTAATASALSPERDAEGRVPYAQGSQSAAAKTTAQKKQEWLVSLLDAAKDKAAEGMTALAEAKERYKTEEQKKLDAFAAYNERRGALQRELAEIEAYEGYIYDPEESSRTLARKQEIRAELAALESAGGAAEAGTGSGHRGGKIGEKTIEWDGRQALLDEYRRLSRAANNNPMNTARREEVRRLLEEGDRKAGNPVQAYSLGDRLYSMTSGALGNVASSLSNAGAVMADLYSRGVISSIPGLPVYSVKDENPIADKLAPVYEYAERLGGDSAAAIEKAKGGLGKLGKAAVDIGTNVIQMGFDAGAGWLTGVGALPVMFARVFGGSALEAKQAGATLDRQAAYGLVKAGIEVWTEKLFGGDAGIYGKGFSDDLTASVIARLTKSDAGAALLYALAGANQEGMEEVISDLLSPFADELIRSGSIQEWIDKGWPLEELLYDYLIGAAVGALGETVSLADGGTAAKIAEARAAMERGEETQEEKTPRDTNSTSEQSTSVDTDPEGAAENTSPENRVEGDDSGGNTMLSEKDLDEYLATGDRAHVRDGKSAILESGESPILTTVKAIHDFIHNALSGGERNVIKGYGRVGNRMASDIANTSNGTVRVDGFFLELDGNRIGHLGDHVESDSDARNKPLTREEAESLTEYIDHYDQVLDVITRKDGQTRVYLAKDAGNGQVVIVELVSKGRHSLQPVTAWKNTYEAFEEAWKGKKGAADKKPTAPIVDKNATRRHPQSGQDVDSSEPTIAQAEEESKQESARNTNSTSGLIWAGSETEEGGGRDALDTVTLADGGEARVTGAVYDAESGKLKLQIEQEERESERRLVPEELLLDEEQGRTLNTLRSILGEEQAADAFNLMERGQDVATFARDYALARNVYGRNGTQPKAEQKRIVQGSLTDAQFKQAWDAGRQTGERLRQSERHNGEPQRNSSAAPKENRESGVSFDGGMVDGERLAPVTETVSGEDVKAVQAMAESLGVRVVFFQSEADASGRYRGHNGIYKDGTVYLDIHAGQNRTGESLSRRTLLFTMSHELTHLIAENAPARYEELRSFVTDWLTAHQNISFRELVEAKQAHGLDYDAAIDEVVADACERVLLSSEAAQEMAEKKQGLFETVQRYVKRFLNRMKARHEEAKAMEPVLRELTAIWDRGLREAMGNRTSDGETENTAPEGGAKHSERETTYSYMGLPADAFFKDGRVYDYDFLTAQEPMRILELPSLSSVKDGNNVSQKKAVDLGMENAAQLGRRFSDSTYLVRNKYTDRDIQVSSGSLEHGLDGGNTGRLRTNARIAAIAGYVVQNGIPINGLTNAKSAKTQVKGTYALASLLRSGDRYVVAIATIEQITGHLESIDTVDVAHSINGRIEKDGRSSTRESEPSSATPISNISIADVLDIVNSTHRSILSDDVLRHFGEERPKEGHYTGRVLFSERDQTRTDRELLLDAASRKGADKAVKDYAKAVKSMERREQKWEQLEEAAKKARAAVKELSVEEAQRRANICDKKLKEAEEAKKAAQYAMTPQTASDALHGERYARELQRREERAEAREKTAAEASAKAWSALGRAKQNEKTLNELEKRLSKYEKELEQAEAAIAEMESSEALHEAAEEARKRYWQEDMGTAIREMRELREANNRLQRTLDEYKKELRAPEIRERRANREDIRGIAELLQEEHSSALRLEYTEQKLRQMGDYVQSHNEGKGIHAEELNRMATELAEDLAAGALYAGYSREVVPAIRDEIVRMVMSPKLRHEMTLLEKAAGREHQRAVRLRNELDKERNERRAEQRAERESREEAIRERVEKIRARQKEQLERQSAVRDIKRIQKKLTRDLTENSAKHHIPDILKTDIGRFLTTLDTLGPFANMGQVDDYLDELDTIRQIAADAAKQLDGNEMSELDLPPELETALQEHINRVREAAKGEGTRRLMRMNLDELRQLVDIMKILSTSVQNANILLSEPGSFRRVSELGDTGVRELEAIRERQSVNVIADEATKAIVWHNMTPYYFFKRMGSAGQAVFSSFTKGWGELARKAKEIIDFAENCYSAKEAQSWETDAHSFELRVRLADQTMDKNGEPVEGGESETVQLTTAQIMEIYCLMQREQAREHLLGGGIKIEQFKNGKYRVQKSAKTYLLTEEDAAKMFGALSERQKEVCTKLQEYMNTTGSEWGNEISLRRYGIRSFTEKHYWPIRTDSNTRDARSPESDRGNFFRLLNQGFTKNTVKHANNAVLIGSVLDSFANHMTDMAKYNALALPMLDAMRWFNYRTKSEVNEQGQFTTGSIRAAMEQAWGKEAGSYFQTLMQDLNGNSEGGRGNSVLQKIASNQKVASVGANLRVALQQPTSIMRAMLVIDGKYLAKGMAMKGGIAKALRWSGLAVWKDLGYFDVNINRGLREQIKHTGGWKEETVEWSMKGAELGDRATWGAIFNACEIETREKTNLSGDELMRAAAQRFDEVIMATQVMDSTLTRSQNMREKGIMSEFTAFMSEPTLTLNTLMDVIMEYDAEARRTDKQTAARRLAPKALKTTMVFTLGSAATALAAALIDVIRDDDEYEKWYQKLYEHFMENFLDNMDVTQLIPVVKDAVNIVFRGKRKDMMSMGLFQKAYEVLQIWTETAELAFGTLDKPTKATWYGNMTAYGKLYKSVEVLSRAGGVPGSALMRDVVGLWNNTIGTLNSGAKLRTYDPGSLKEIQYAVQDGYLNAEQAKTILVKKGLADEEEAERLSFKWSLENSEVFGEAVQDWKTVSADGTLGSYEKGRQQREIVKRLEATEEQKLRFYRTMSGSDSRAEKFESMMEAGLSLNECFDAYDAYARIDADESRKQNDKANAFVAWVNRQGYSAEEKAAVMENLKYWQMVPITGTKTEKLLDAGLGTDEAEELSGMLTEALAKADDGNGSISQPEAKAALDAMDIPIEQKALLWQTINKSWKAKNNPYDTEIGQTVYDRLNGGRGEETGALTLGTW